MRLAVVHRHRLAARQDVEVEAELGKVLCALEVAVPAHLVREPFRVPGIEDVPAFAFGLEPAALGFARAGPPSCPDPRVGPMLFALLFVPAIVALTSSRGSWRRPEPVRMLAAAVPPPVATISVTSTRSRRSTRCSRSSRTRRCTSAGRRAGRQRCRRLERLADKLEAAAASLERVAYRWSRPSRTATTSKPAATHGAPDSRPASCRGPPDTPLLLLGDRLARVAVRGPALSFDLDEAERAPTPHDQDGRVAARPRRSRQGYASRAVDTSAPRALASFT